MMSCRSIGYVCLALMLLTSVVHAEEADNPNDPEVNFDYLWDVLDRTYAQFEVKNVDWDALYDVYRPQVTSATSESELFEIMMTMLRHLNDSHVCIDDGSGRACAGLSDELPRDDFSLDLVKSKYLDGAASTAMDGNLTFGWLTDKVAYMHIGDFKDGPGQTAAEIDRFLERFGSADAIILDVRFNPGGGGAVVKAVADRFADRKRHYETTQVRYGLEHDDLGPPRYWYVEPDGPLQYTKTTVLLTHRLSESAADGFRLAMGVLPHVTVVGDLTAGAFSSQFPGRLPNGWTVWIAFKVAFDNKGTCWDGIGVSPDLRITNTKADIDAGNDRVLDFAIRLAERGNLELQDESSSLVHLKTSLVEKFADDVESIGVEAALASLNEARASGDDAFFLTADEIARLSGGYLAREKYDTAIAILEVCIEEFPQFASIYAMLAGAYLGVGDIEAAEAALKRGSQVTPMLPFEIPQIERAKRQFEKQKRGSAVDLIRQTLTKDGIEAAGGLFEELLPTRDSGPVFDENDFNRLGYYLLQNGDHDAAICVFEMNVKLYPDSWNVYDSLGEACLSAGKNELAAKHYSKSIELNPANRNAKEILERLESER